ncbi:MAG: MoaD/ThiS family protein [Candidatus Sumerlaeia bacterium]|nr:MoaD/ThiS family protein [Candidatus Sumerlaeia bacterium]
MTEGTPATATATLRIKVYGPLREFVAAGEFAHATASGRTVRQVILETGVPEEHLVYTMCLVNGRRVKLDEPVQDGDALDIFQPVAGG